MIRLLTSPVWGSVPKGVYQEWGCTTLTVEPPWPACGVDGHFHCGIDVGDMAIGYPLHAARAGTVVSVGYGQLGIQVGAEVDWYIHIDRSAVSVGQVVAQGELVAYVGSKVPAGGALYGAHLHFERQTAAAPHYNLPGTSRDPVAVLTALFASASASLSTPTIRRLAMIIGHSDVLQWFTQAADNSLAQLREGVWRSLGGVMTSDVITGYAHGQYFDIQVRGENNKLWQRHSDDAGATWGPWVDLQGATPGMIPLTGAGPDPATGAPPAAVDLSQLVSLAQADQSQLAAMKSELDAIKARTDKDLAQ